MRCVEQAYRHSSVENADLDLIRSFSNMTNFLNSLHNQTHRPLTAKVSYHICIQYMYNVFSTERKHVDR